MKLSISFFDNLKMLKKNLTLTTAPTLKCWRNDASNSCVGNWRKMMTCVRLSNQLVKTSFSDKSFPFSDVKIDGVTRASVSRANKWQKISFMECDVSFLERVELLIIYVYSNTVTTQIRNNWIMFFNDEKISSLIEGIKGYCSEQ